MAKKKMVFYGPHDEDYDRWGDFPDNPLIFPDDVSEKKTAKKTKDTKKKA